MNVLIYYDVCSLHLEPADFDTHIYASLSPRLVIAAVSRIDPQVAQVSSVEQVFDA